MNSDQNKSLEDLVSKLGRTPFAPPGPDSVPKSGFFPLEEQKICRDLQHNPPSHMVIPPGQGYLHVCPSCQRQVKIFPQTVSMAA